MKKQRNKDLTRSHNSSRPEDYSSTSSCFLVEVGLFFVGREPPFFPGEQAAYTSQGNQINNEFANASLFTQFWGIFTNNFRIAAIEMIPGFGVVLFGFSLYATARILEVMAVSGPYLASYRPYRPPAALFRTATSSCRPTPSAIGGGTAACSTPSSGGSEEGRRAGRLRELVGRGMAGYHEIDLMIVTVMLIVAALFKSRSKSSWGRPLLDHLGAVQGSIRADDNTEPAARKDKKGEAGSAIDRDKNGR